jgi:hypothetical protein
LVADLCYFFYMFNTFFLSFPPLLIALISQLKQNYITAFSSEDIVLNTELPSVDAYSVENTAYVVSHKSSYCNVDSQSGKLVVNSKLSKHRLNISNTKTTIGHSQSVSLRSYCLPSCDGMNYWNCKLSCVHLFDTEMALILNFSFIQNEKYMWNGMFCLRVDCSPTLHS